MTYEVAYKDGLATLRVTPEAVTGDCIQAMKEIISAPWLGEMLCLLVIDKGSAFSPTREELGELKELLGVILSGPDVKTAAVVSKIVHFGIGRALEARVDEGGRMRVFMNEQAAREWLGACAL